MRFVVAPDFSKKAIELGGEVLLALAKFLKFVETSSKPQIIEESISTATTDEEAIFVYKSVGVFFVFTFDRDRVEGNDDEGEEFLLLVDIAADRSNVGNNKVTRGRTSDDPKFNSQINPKFNSQINPKFNSQINPKFNSQINPKFNSQINPKFNSQINPKFNSQINPKFNSQINPKFNSALNPIYNWSIDPSRNTGASISRVYDLDLNVEGFIVRANENFILIFDTTKKYVGYVVGSGEHNLNFFTEAGEWKEFWVNIGNERFLRFDLDANWIGIMT